MSEYEYEIDGKAAKELKKFPKSDQEKILNKIDSLKENPRPPGCEPLNGKLSDYYRVRFGNYRIVYEVFDNRLLILVVKIAGRGHVYKKK
jgi:mRNA interferase RelE/StbE